MAKARKPIRRSMKARLRKQAESKRIAEVRAAVWARSGGRCECCGDTEAESMTKHGPLLGAHEMHEYYQRSMTMKRPPEERFDTRWCGRLCKVCHAAHTEHRKETVFWSVFLGADGDKEIITNKNEMKGFMAHGFSTAREVWLFHTAPIAVEVTS